MEAMAEIMTEDEKPKDSTIFETIGANLGQLYVLSMYQARATLVLAKAIEKDPSTSSDLKEAAKESLELIDSMIEKLEKSVEDDASISSIRDFVGRTQNE